MNTDPTNNELFKRYLLDDLSEAEAGIVEESFLTDDAAYEDMLAVEDELFYEYKQNDLTPRERETFEQKFLRSREDRDRAAFAGAFLEATAGMSREHNVAFAPAVDERPSFLQTIAAFFRFSGPAMQFGMAAAVLLLFIGVIALFVQNSRLRNEMASSQQQNEAERKDREAQLAAKQAEQQDIEKQLSAEREKSGGNEERIKELESERQKLESDIKRRRTEQQPDAQRSPAMGTLATLIISPGRFTRSDGQPMNHVDIVPSVRTLGLRLQLKNVDDYEKFSVIVTTIDDGKTILSKSHLRASGKGPNRSLVLKIPAASLQQADYEVALSGITKTGQTENITKYYFTVHK